MDVGTARIGRGALTQCRSNLRVICASSDGFIASPSACWLPLTQRDDSLMKSLTALIGLIALGSASVASAQTAPPPDSTAPSSASSPSERAATSSHAVEAPTTNGTTPASAASPHQQQVASGAKSGGSTPQERKKMMKECMTAEKNKNSGMTKEEMKSTCMNQVKDSSQK